MCCLLIPLRVATSFAAALQQEGEPPPDVFELVDWMTELRIPLLWRLLRSHELLLFTKSLVRHAAYCAHWPANFAVLNRGLNCRPRILMPFWAHIVSARQMHELGILRCWLKWLRIKQWKVLKAHKGHWRQIGICQVCCVGERPKNSIVGVGLLSS